LCGARRSSRSSIQGRVDTNGASGIRTNEIGNTERRSCYSHDAHQALVEQGGKKPSVRSSCRPKGDCRYRPERVRIYPATESPCPVSGWPGLWPVQFRYHNLIFTREGIESFFDRIEKISNRSASYPTDCPGGMHEVRAGGRASILPAGMPLRYLPVSRPRAC